MAKKNTKGIIIGVVAACAAIGALTPNKKVESIELSIPAYQTEYDINTKIPIDVSIIPEHAKADSIEYIASSDSITFSGSTINTGSDEGTFEIYVIAGDIESNIVSINVTDISARNEATARAEEERLAKEAEEQKAAEEQATKEKEEKASAEQSAHEAEEQKVAEEQAAKATEEKAAAEQAASEAVADTPEADSTPAPQPAEESVQIVEVQPQEIPVNGTAYLSATGKKYHKIDHCGKMNPNNARETTVSEAKAAGYEPCSKCW